MGFIQLPKPLCFPSGRMRELCYYPFHQVSSLYGPSFSNNTYQVHIDISAHAFTGDFWMKTSL